MARVVLSSGGLLIGYHIARHLESSGHLQRFLTMDFSQEPDGIPPEKIKRLAIPAAVGMGLDRLPGANSKYFSYLIRDNLYDLLTRRFVKDADIFHVFNHFGLHSMRRARRLGMKILVARDSAHPRVQLKILQEEYQRYGLSFSRIGKILFKKHEQEYEEADRILIPSEFVKRTMIEQGLPEKKLMKIPLGFDPDKFQHHPNGKEDDTFRILFVGSISLQKGVQYLLEAFKQLNLPDTELVLVGGTFPDSNSFLPKYEGLYQRVPFVPQGELSAIYNSASVFVLPSLQDGFGMVVYEAAACGLPVIITENVGAAIRDGRDGYVVPIRDPDALADRLLRLYEDETLRQEMGQSAREYVQQFTWQAYHRQVLTHYQTLMNDMS